MKLVVDMNLALDWVPFLKERGFDCEHWSTLGEHDARDEVIANHCREIGATVLSADLDFAKLHAIRGSDKPSVIQLRAADQLPSALGHSVARALTFARRELEQGAIITITPLKVRVARLPIGNLDNF